MKWPEYAPEDAPRLPFQNRPTKGKTLRKQRFRPSGRKTNVGDPNKISRTQG
jgi:hypothetical protein